MSMKVLRVECKCIHALRALSPFTAEVDRHSRLSVMVKRSRCKATAFRLV